MHYSPPLFRRPWVWIRRFRHRRGYGVHSPFAYSFLRGVVYERGTYYAYAALDGLHPWWVRWLKAYPLQCSRLLFRLANYVHPHTIVLLGDRPTERAYMAAAVPTARWVTPDGMPPDGTSPHSTPSPLEHSAPPDLLFVSHEHLKPFHLPPMPPASMVIAEGIHHDSDALAAWHRLQHDPQTVITFDLYDYGIILFGPRLNRQHYIVNF